MGALGLERRLGKRGFGTDSVVDPLGLCRVDTVLAFPSKASGFVGRRPDWLNQQWAIEEFYDVRYPFDVRIRVLYGCHRCPCDIRFVFTLLPRCVAETFTGAFVVGLVVPRQGNLAIAMTEKLEDMVSIIFLPLVCVPKPSHDYIELTYLIVLHTFWSFDRSRSTKLWYHLGIHDRHLRLGLHWQIRRMLHCGTVCRVQLA